ncbi:MAG: ATP-binding protein [Clostridia bacterium]|nr:ATP-binding protein [Clostridia bacterium]
MYISCGLRVRSTGRIRPTTSTPPLTGRLHSTRRSEGLPREETSVSKKLTREEKKQIAAAIRKAKRERKEPHSAQETIPYQRMWPDGVCRVTDTLYTKTIQFQDINYQLAQNEDKTAIFEGWCDFLNYFDSSIRFQFSFLNLAAGMESFEQSIFIPDQNDEFDDIRQEYAEMLQNQLSKGNNGLKKTKYITFAIEADSIKTAKPRLERVETDLINSFKRLGVAAESLNGKERLQLLHSVFHMDTQERFQFEWRWLAPSGLSTKDFIAPSSFEFRDSRSFRMGKKLGAASFLQILAPELNDRMLADFLSMESSLIVNMHVQSIDQTEAIKMIKRKITDLDRMKIEEQKKAVRAGYDMDIISSDIVTYGGDAKKLLQDMQSHNERMFLLTFLVLNTADGKQQLENNVFQAQGIAQKYNCALTRLDFQQEQALISSLPLGLNQIEIQRGLTTSSTAIFVPFTTQELFQTGGEELYYGLNALSNNLIMVDRKKLKNPNGLILGTPGSGKSFSAKREIANSFLITGDDIIICDPEGEYFPLVQRLHGQVIRVSPTSGDYINPMDVHLDYSDDENPLSLKSDFILSLCELIVGGREGLQPIEKTVIDRVVRIVYQKYLNDPKPENVPILEDLYRALLEQEEKEAKHIATALEIYVTGSLNVFNHRTNVDIHNRLVCYDIKELGKQLKKIGMLIVQDQVWGRVTANRAEGRSTRYYMDEFHLLLKEEQTAAYSVEIWKRFRKWGGIPTGITQNVKDLLASREIENIFENSDFIYMLNQAGGDRQILSKQLNISPHQLSYVTHSGEGEGLLFYGNVILPFQDRFPKDTELYRIMTTKPNEVAKKEEENDE